MSSLILQKISLDIKSYPLKQSFNIARGSKNTADVIEIKAVFSIAGEFKEFMAEGLPYPRYGETTEKMESLFGERIFDFMGLSSREAFQKMFPKASSLCNALDFVFWQAEAFAASKTVPEILGISSTLKPIPLYATISLASVEQMVKEAKRHQDVQCLKIKLDAQDIEEKIQAIADAVPHKQLLLDANESWNLKILNRIAAYIENKKLSVIMIEQPLAEGDDNKLQNYEGKIPLMADESCQTLKKIDKILRYYDVFNIKLDKTGGMTEALKLLNYLQSKDKKVMIGCMVSSSLSILPAFYLAQLADYADLDGAIFLTQDPYDKVIYENGFCVENS